MSEIAQKRGKLLHGELKKQQKQQEFSTLFACAKKCYEWFLCTLHRLPTSKICCNQREQAKDPGAFKVRLLGNT